MKILYAASEAAPFAKSGGLADVAGALPKALVRDGIDARVVMPLYGDLKFKDTLTYVTNFSVPVGWRSQYCGLFKAERDGVVFYFIDNEYYFKRSGLYGFYDDGERFAFFSRAILEMLFYTDFEPDIINCNDWQTALTPVYLNLYYRHLDKFSRIKTVFTIHNIAYQGKYGLDILEDTCGIGARDAHVVEYDGCANFMKGAIECADKVTTVSPTYAQEILDPWFSHGLDGLLRQKQYKLCGILNGIDVDVFNPATDPDIAKNYDAETFQEGKAVCKEALQDEFGLHKDGSPVMAMVTRLVGHKGVDLVQPSPRVCCSRASSWSSSAPARPSMRTSSTSCAHATRAASVSTSLQRQTGTADLRRCRHLPDAVPLRALRPGPDGLLPLRHDPRHPRDRRPEGLYPRLRRRLRQRLYLCQLQRP